MLAKWEMFYAKKIKAIDLPVHIYYQIVSGSIVNTISKIFFKKSYLLEPPQFQWLKDEGLLDDYMNIRFNNFFRDWYLKKLSKCKLEDKEESTKIVLDSETIKLHSRNAAIYNIGCVPADKCYPLARMSQQVFLQYAHHRHFSVKVFSLPSSEILILFLSQKRKHILTAIS